MDYTVFIPVLISFFSIIRNTMGGYLGHYLVWYIFIAAWASDYVKLATGLNLLKGYDTGDFKPSNNLKRDEAMVVVYRLISQLEK